MSDQPMYVSNIRTLLNLKSTMTGRPIEINELAAFVGVSRQTISAWISDRGLKTLPAADRQLKLEQFFGVPWSRIWILDAGTEQNDPAPVR